MAIPTPLKFIGGAALAALLVAGGLILASRGGYLEKPHDVVESRHIRPDSQFVEIDGVRIHYVMEGAGEGPTILLMHGSYLDLGIWDSWAADLKARHRVVRLDRTPFGLTGLDPENRYSYERETELLEGFVEKLNLDQIILVGTSSAGTAAARYAAANPEKIAGVALFNFPLAARVIQPPPAYATIRWIRNSLLLNYQPASYTRGMVEANTADDANITPQLIARLTDEANRKGVLNAQRALERAANGYSEEKRMADLKAIRAPALLIWGAENPLLSQEGGQEALKAVGSDRKKIEIIFGASHMIPIDKPKETLIKFKEFFEL